MSDDNSSSPFSVAVERPWYLTALAVAFLLWGAGTSFQFLGFTLSAISSGSGPAYLLWFFVYMQVLWWSLFVAGVGIFRGVEWSRWLMSAALVGILVGTSFPPFAVEGQTLVKVVGYPILIGLTFTKRASAFFASRKDERTPKLTA